MNVYVLEISNGLRHREYSSCFSTGILLVRVSMKIHLCIAHWSAVYIILRISSIGTLIASISRQMFANRMLNLRGISAKRATSKRISVRVSPIAAHGTERHPECTQSTSSSEVDNASGKLRLHLGQHSRLEVMCRPRIDQRLDDLTGVACREQLKRSVVWHMLDRHVEREWVVVAASSTAAYAARRI